MIAASLPGGAGCTPAALRLCRQARAELEMKALTRGEIRQLTRACRGRGWVLSVSGSPGSAPVALQQHVDVCPEQLLLGRCSLASKELLIAGLWEECRVRSVEATRALIRKVLFVLDFFCFWGRQSRIFRLCHF